MTEISVTQRKSSTPDSNSSPGEPSRRALSSIPCIDISPFTQNGSDHERQRIAREVHDACVDIGFFYIEGHGFSAGELKDSLNWSRQFFTLPVEQKLAVTAK